MGKVINVDNKFEIGNGKLTILAGPCAIESEEMSLEVAKQIKEICDKLDLNYVFKSSFDKANRSSIHSKRGVGLEKGLEILKKVKDEVGVPIVTDIHKEEQAEAIAKVADIIQIPAFLSRQTDLLVASANTGKIVNIKKGQFMAPSDTKNIINKMLESNNDNIMLCERGTSFGYNQLVVDMTGMVEMKSYGYPVVFDATHSVQKPGGNGTTTGGNREMVPYLVNAAISLGIDTIFLEVHPDPENAFSDGPNQVRLSEIEKVLTNAKIIFDAQKNLK